MASMAGSPQAAVLVPLGAVGERDARELADALEAAGWAVTPVPIDRPAEALVEQIAALRAELVGVPASDAAQVRAAQLPCALLRRLPAPPLIVGIQLASAATNVASELAADHVVGDVDALAPLLRRRLGDKGGAAPAWGVHLHRDGPGLVVAPIGLLDAASVARLREIVETRRPLYPRIVLDLRELLEAGAPGLAALVSWDAEQPWEPTVAALGDARTLAALAEAGLSDTLPLAAV